MAPAGYTASPAFPWTDSGGVITLAEPLSVEELQTGALVLRVRRDGAEAVDAVGVASVRASDQTVISVNFYCYGVHVAQMGSNSGYQAGVFEISWIDRGHSWEVVGLRIDKQYWHGGMLNDFLDFRNSTSGSPDEGEDCILRCYLNLGESAIEVGVSVGGVGPLGGRFVGNSRALVYGGSDSIQNGAVFLHAGFSLGWPLVKAVPMLIDGQVALQLLYPLDNWNGQLNLMSEGGAYIQSLATPGPFYLLEI